MRAGAYTCVYTPDRHRPSTDRFTRAGLNPGTDGAVVAGQSAVKRCEQWHFGVRERARDANRLVHTTHTHTHVNATFVRRFLICVR